MKRLLLSLLLVVGVAFAATLSTPTVAKAATISLDLCYDQTTGHVCFVKSGGSSWSRIERGARQAGNGKWFAVVTMEFDDTGSYPQNPLDCNDNSSMGWWAVSPLPAVPGQEPYPSTTPTGATFYPPE
jgi:hypothetical protein